MSRISSIYNQAHAEPPTGAEAKRRNHEAMKQAWQHRGLLCVDPEYVNNWADRQHLINVAESLYGKRKGK